MSVQILPGVPAARADIVEQLCLNLGASNVQQAPQAHGFVTLIVTYPDSAALEASLTPGRAAKPDK